MEDSRLKAHLLHLIAGRGFYKKGEGNRTKRSREGVEKFSMCRQAQSILIRQVMVWWASSCFSHPGFTSSQLHTILAPWLKVSKSPQGGMPQGRSLYFSKFLGFYTNMLFIYKLHISQSQHLHKNVRRMVGWVRIPHC